MSIQRINVSFPFPVEMTEAAHAALHDAVELMCAAYEKARPDRVMWAAGEGGTPPPGFFFNEPKGDWDMSVLNIEVAERERYDTDRTAKLSASAELREHITKEVERLTRGIERYREGVKSDNVEYRTGSEAFLRKYERELRILRLAQHALGMSPLEKENTELRDALKPFADCAAQLEGSEDVPRAPDGEWAKFRLLTDDYRRAARAMGPTKATASENTDRESK